MKCEIYVDIHHITAAAGILLLHPGNNADSLHFVKCLYEILNISRLKVGDIYQIQMMMIQKKLQVLECERIQDIERK